jgi:hypothetical protein
LSPLISRATWPLMMAQIFGPRPVPRKFEAFPKGMALRPPQVRASAAESALMIPDAFYLRNQYADLKMPGRHHRRRARPVDRHRGAVGQAAFRHFAEQISPSSRNRPHGASNCC